MEVAAGGAGHLDDVVTRHIARVESEEIELFRAASRCAVGKPIFDPSRQPRQQSERTLAGGRHGGFVPPKSGEPPTMVPEIEEIVFGGVLGKDRADKLLQSDRVVHVELREIDELRVGFGEPHGGGASSGQIQLSDCRFQAAK